MENSLNPIKMKVIGVGGAGSNTINLLFAENEKLIDVEFYVANTDIQDLDRSNCPNKLFLGKNSKGYGAGSDPLVGQQCALESLNEIQKILEGTDILILTTGLGGGTGTGATPIIAEIAKSLGILTIVIATTPFKLEGKVKNEVANKGLDKIKNTVDSYIILSNQKLITLYNKVPIFDAFKISNITIKKIIKALYDTIFKTGYMNIDFNDIRKVLSNGQSSLIGVGHAFGKERAKKAIENAFYTPLFQNQIKNASKMIVLYQCDEKTNFEEIEIANDLIDQYMSNNKENYIDKIIGFQLVPNKSDFFQVNIIASNINDQAPILKNSDYENTNVQTLLHTVITNLNQGHKNSSLDNSKEDKDTIPDFFDN